MGKWELGQAYKRVNRAINYLAIGLYLLILSPMVFTALCANRIYEMSIINTLGVGWILLCVLLALPLLIRGSSTLIHYIRLESEYKKIVLVAGLDKAEWKRRFHNRIVNAVILGVMLGVLSVFPVITVSTLRLSNNEYVAYSYSAVFILAGAGVCCILASLAKVWIQAQVQIVESENSDEIRKIGRTRGAAKKIRRGIVIIVAIVIVFVVMSRGTYDTEFIASHSEEELQSLFQSFSYESTGSLLYPNREPSITGRSNQIILVKNGDGTVNQALYLIDSNSYSSLKLNDYDYIHQDQVDWYANSLQEISQGQDQLVSSLIFTHMPLQEFKTAYDLYKEGSSEVTYYFGKVGEKDEAICCSNYPSNLFHRAVELGSTKGIFVGHDHYNTISMEYKKIRLTYGMSIDYLAMPGISKRTEQRGGTIITLHPDSSIEIEQVPYQQ